MYRGTTPTLTFTLPIEADTITLLNIAFSQRHRIAFEKSLNDVIIDGTTISLTLSEEETLQLKSDGSPLEIQLRVGVGAARMASDIFTVPVSRIIQGGLLDEI